MSVATVADNKTGKKPHYKDYVSFLENYRNGKKEDQNSVITNDSGVSFSLNNSSNNSSSSVYSDLADPPKSTFKEYLESYNNKKYSPVQPPIQMKKQPEQQQAETKTVKTEVFLEITSPPSMVTKVVDITNAQNASNVSKVSKIFEKNVAPNENIITKTVPPSGKVNTFNFGQKDAEIKREQRKISMGEISRKFEGNNHKVTLKKSHSISEKSRVFEDTNKSDATESSMSKTNGCVSPKPPINNMKPVLVPKVATEDDSPKINGSVSPKHSTNIKPIIIPKAITATLVLQQKEETNSAAQMCNIKPVTAPKPSTDTTHSEKSLNTPPPPPPFPQPNFQTPPQERLIICAPPSCPPPPPPVPQSGPSTVPPPPPPPPANFSVKIVQNSPPKPAAPVQKVAINGVAAAPKKNDVVDGTQPVIDKNDPRVKRLVYGALREMYGAYHDKANDYIATLPRNRVKKNNGLDSIISSIAQQSQLLGTGPRFGPPPPPLSTGQFNALYLETPTQIRTMDPPQCVQNAMMTKDKKPFTYTPGGIDLSEVRSPRMQRRIERNANLAGAGDIPRPQLPPPQNLGALPPSVQAAMRPQPQVQVFPSGPPPPPPMSRGGAPPPPPPFNAPPPPPPPSGPLPTQKVTTADNQVLERPDMTKIIPDNPMAMLRKTGGPAPRKSIVDEIFSQEGKAAPISVTPPSGRFQPQFEQQQQRYQPPVVERGAPISPVPQQYQPPPPQPQQYQQSRQQYQPTPPQQQYQPQPPQQRSPEATKEPPRYQPPVIERQPTIPRQNNVQPEVKTSTAHLGSLYIPPVNQQAQPQRRVVSPPSPPERNTDSPSLQTPPLKEAPRPWQAKKSQQEDIPPWAKRNEERSDIQDVQQTPPPTVQQQQQQRWPQQREQQQPAQQFNQQQQYNQQPQQIQQPAGVPVRIIIRTNTGPGAYQQPPQQQEPDAKIEAVYVTQPVVLQHPGPRAPPQQQQPQQQWQEQIAPPYKVDNQGARVIPIAVEGTNQESQSPTTPGSNRSLNRQQSWSNNPSQSNSFKIIQKITQTDDDEEDENVPVTEHGPRYPQNFQQPSADQLRRMKVNEGDQNLMNKFKQEIHYHDEENPRYRGGHIPSKVFRILDESATDDDNNQREVDPRYRGAAIPSKAFKLLQNMTGPGPNQYAKETVPTGPQPQRKGPQVRTIPVQIENDDQPQPYVHPSEQVVPEPKKYTGSSIPSRSFKILQAMTAPDNCANADEQYEATPYEQWGYDPNYPPYPAPPYWHDYYQYYYQEPQAGLSKEESTDTSARTTPRQTPTPTPRHTPVPFWNYMPPYPYPPSRRASTTEGESDAETATNPRSTPLPFWGEEAQTYPQYPPYYDPYYYSYYYGYPPMYPPYPYYAPNSDTDDFAGYSSTDEMAYYNNQRGRRRNSFSGSLRATTPKIVVTPTLNVKETVVNKKVEVEKPKPEPQEINTSESDDSDTETEEDNRRNTPNNPLKSIRSVNNILLYAEEDDSRCSDDEVGIEEFNEDGNEEIDEENSVYLVDDDSYPHQLSVIYEQSERTDSRMRSASAMSDSTTIAERSDDEDTSPNIINANKPFKFCVSVTEEEKEEIKAVVSIGDREIKTFEENLKEEDSVEPIIQEYTEENPVIRPDNHLHYHDEEEGKDSDESEDWWGIIGKEDDLPAPRPIIPKKGNVSNENIQSQSPINKVNIENTEEIDEKKEKIQTATHLTEKEPTTSKKIDEIKSKNNYARAKSVYDKIDEFEEEVNTGKLIEMESFVAKLEQMQKESGLWNIRLPRKVGDKSSNVNQKTNSKEKVCNAKFKAENCPVNEKEPKSTNRDTKIRVNNTDKNEESNEIDFWSTLKNEKEEVVPRSKVPSKNNSSASYNNYSCSKSMSEESEENETTSSTDQGTSSIKITNVETEEVSKSTEETVESDDSTEETDSSEDESEDHEQQENDLNNNEEKEVQPMSIQQRIQALKETIRQKQSKLQQQQEQEMKNSVKDKISAIETTGQNRSKTTSTKSSVKSFEEYSEEEEGDSGVTSDMSRHISDTEEFPELKKLTRYQRAATHSRLFKLLQDECENEDDEEEEEQEEEISPNSTNDKFSNLSVRKNNAPNTEPPRRDKLSLPLQTNETESLCSSGITSPGSPVNEKLVNELVQSLLKRKKGQMFRNMPKEKLFAAAARIIQEDLEGLDTSSEDCSSFLSPLRESTGCSTAAQTPQEFNGNYDEYKQYYETWSEAERIYDENYDILPSKAFKLLQEHSSLSKTGTIAGLLAKCPRVLSSKNIHKKLLKLLESSDASSPTPENPLESNEVTSAS